MAAAVWESLALWGVKGATLDEEVIGLQAGFQDWFGLTVESFQG